MRLYREFLPVEFINEVPDTEDRLQKLVLADEIDWEEYDCRIESLLRAGDERLMIQNEPKPPAAKFPAFGAFVLTVMAIGLVWAVVFGSQASSRAVNAHNHQIAVERMQQDQRAYREFACMAYKSWGKAPPACK